DARTIPEEQPETDLHDQGEDPGPQPAAHVSDPVDDEREQREADDGSRLARVGRSPVGEPVADRAPGHLSELPERAAQGDDGPQGRDEDKADGHRTEKAPGAACGVALIDHGYPLTSSGRFSRLAGGSGPGQ